MTSRKKISVIIRAAKTHECSVLLKVGAPPGIMLCEGDEVGVKEWETVVRVSVRLWLHCFSATIDI
jgi:hypothetical protein